jgi:hypothetical protein
MRYLGTMNLTPTIDRCALTPQENHDTLCPLAGFVSFGETVKFMLRIDPPSEGCRLPQGFAVLSGSGGETARSLFLSPNL